MESICIFLAWVCVCLSRNNFSFLLLHSLFVDSSILPLCPSVWDKLSAARLKGMSNGDVKEESPAAPVDEVTEPWTANFVDAFGMTGFIHKCELLDICSCKFGQADRQRNKPKYGYRESHILPPACQHLI